MGLTTKLVQELSAIQALTDWDIDHLHTLIIDFFAAAYAGYKQNRPFNQAVEFVVYPQGGAEESSVLCRAAA